MKESWKHIIGLEDYRVSTFGQVKTYKKGGGRRLKQSTDKFGYKYVILMKGGFRHTKKVHRLVAEAFCGNPDNKPNVNHINGKKGDNHFLNIEWCTQAENIRHAFDTGLSNQKGHKNNNSKLTKYNLVQIKYDYFEFGDTQEEIAKRFGVSQGTISNVIKEKCYSD